MKFEDFVRLGTVKRRRTDKSLAKSLKKTAKIDLKFLERIGIDDISARKIVSGYYDVLREVLEAIVTLKGYKIYSHEAFAYFLREEGDVVMAEKFDRFRLIRNRINYYRKSVSCDEAKEYCLEMKKMIVYFMKRLTNEIER